MTLLLMINFLRQGSIFKKSIYYTTYYIIFKQSVDNFVSHNGIICYSWDYLLLFIDFPKCIIYHFLYDSNQPARMSVPWFLNRIFYNLSLENIHSLCSLWYTPVSLPARKKMWWLYKVSEEMKNCVLKLGQLAVKKQHSKGNNFERFQLPF